MRPFLPTLRALLRRTLRRANRLDIQPTSPLTLALMAPPSPRLSAFLYGLLAGFLVIFLHYLNSPSSGARTAPSSVNINVIFPASSTSTDSGRSQTTTSSGSRASSWFNWNPFKRNGVPDYEDLSLDSKRTAIKESFLHAFHGYQKYSWGADELKPISRKGKNWGGRPGSGFGLTILDSLDTIWLMGLTEYFQECLAWIESELSFDADIDISNFEITIRALGGLLSAYELSGERHSVLLRTAIELGTRLLPAYNTTSGIPKPIINLRTGKGTVPQYQIGHAILAEFGSVQLELKSLALHARQRVYFAKATNIMDLLNENMPEDGLFPVEFDPFSKTFSSEHITLGAFGDSFYEYLLKQWLLTAKVERRYLTMFRKAAHGILHKLVHRSPMVFVSQIEMGFPVHKMDHLACFVGGLFAVAYAECLNCEEREDWFQFAKDLGETCHVMYASTPTGLGPEIVQFDPEDGEMKAHAQKYILRPEAVETWFYLWRYTKDEKWRRYGWQMYQALEKHCRVDHGYSGIRSVMAGSSDHPIVLDDLMQSFLLAETFKYLYLLFAEDEILDLSQVVLNTEAHPLKRWKTVPVSFADLLRTA